MFTITVFVTFEAAHQITLPDGSKEPLHSHEWKLRAEVSSERLDNMGIVMDFHLLRRLINDIIEPLRGRALGEFEALARNNESAESVALYVFERLEPALCEGARLEKISVEEEPGCVAAYARSAKSL